MFKFFPFVQFSVHRNRKKDSPKSKLLVSFESSCGALLLILRIWSPVKIILSILIDTECCHGRFCGSLYMRRETERKCE